MSYNYNTRSSTLSSLLHHVFSLNPLPYPVLLILALLSFFLAIQWYVSLEDVVDATQDTMGWLLLAAPLLLLLALRFLSASSSDDDDDDASQWRRFFYALWPDTRRRTNNYQLFDGDGGGSSPWGVAALIVLLLVLVQYQSVFLETWFV